MKSQFQQFLLDAMRADTCREVEEIQSLWSGYGAIKRFALTGGDQPSVIVKHVKLPDDQHHPRGWNTNFSHQRKINSYQVESAWYEQHSALCDDSCRVPRCFGTDTSDNEFLIVMEDLDSNGYPRRKESVSFAEMTACLRWLANFHATFLGHKPENLWQIGTYWHLDTRPDELQALDDQALKRAAPKIDQLLQTSPYQTFVHGDAKLANFCFSKDATQVAAVDFQYVGGGCGMKDVAYFIGSCLYEEDCERYESELLDIYFSALKNALTEKRVAVEPALVEQSWRALFPVAWTDFHRFLKGWSPGHWKIHDYSEKLSRQVLAQFDQQRGKA